MSDNKNLDFLTDRLQMTRRSFLQSTAAGAAALGAGSLIKTRDAEAFPYEPYPRDDDLTTVVTSCAHNCGSRHMLVAHKKGDVIVRLTTDDGRYQRDGYFGKDTEEEPQVRACLRGRSYRQRLYSAERLLYPMGRVGKRGEGKFKRLSWDEALEYVARKMIEIKNEYGSTALLDQSYAGASYGVLHKSDQIEGLLGRFLGMFGCRTNSWSVPSYQGTTTSSRWTFGTIEDGNEDDAFAHSKLIIMWGWNPAYTFHGGNTFYYMRMAKQRGCKFVLIDPQYTDSAAAYDAWWIPIRPNTDAAMIHSLLLMPSPFVRAPLQRRDVAPGQAAEDVPGALPRVDSVAAPRGHLGTVVLALHRAGLRRGPRGPEPGRVFRPGGCRRADARRRPQAGGAARR